MIALTALLMENILEKNGNMQFERPSNILKRQARLSLGGMSGVSKNSVEIKYEMDIGSKKTWDWLGNSKEAENGDIP
jgi:hypothetical protein